MMTYSILDKIIISGTIYVLFWFITDIFFPQVIDPMKWFIPAVCVISVITNLDRKITNKEDQK